MCQTRTTVYYVLSVISVFLSGPSAAHRCDHFKGVNGGVITYDPDDEVSLAQNTVAVLRCRNGNVREAICTDQGWEPASLGECRVNLDEPTRGLITRDEPRSCVPLTNIENGFVTYSPFGLPPYKSGTAVNLICNLGFAPVGSTTTKCENGNWGHLGMCQPSVAQQCPPIPEVNNGQISYIAGGNGPFGYGAVAELTCTLGSSVIGNNRVSCEPGGWGPFPGLGKCEEGFGTTGQCPALLALNGQVNYIQANSQVPYSSGTTAMLVCNSGYMPSGSTTSYCSGSVWSPTIGQCTLGGTGGFGGVGGIGGVGGLGGVNCLGMGVPLNGQLSFSQGGTLGPYPSGTSVTVMCNPGSTVSGTPTAFCQNGQWSPPTLGQCMQGGFGGGLGNGIGTGTSCFAVPMPLNGQVQYSQFGSIGTYPNGATATLICNPGSTVYGTASSTCQGGQWYPPLGQCQGGGGLGGGFGGIGGVGGFGQCVAGMPPVLGGTVQYSQGGVFGPYPSGTTATLMCSNGAPNVGQNTASCQNGMWNPPSFINGCNGGGFGGGIGGGIGGIGGIGGGQCGFGIAGVLNGNVQYSQGGMLGPFPVGTVATLVCNPGSVPAGQSSASCMNGMWNPPNIGPCNMNGIGSPGGIGGLGGFGGGFGTASACYALPQPGNGQLTYSMTPTGFGGSYPAGTTATVTCNIGFQPIGPTTSSCQATGWSSFSMGSCIQSIG